MSRKHILLVVVAVFTLKSCVYVFHSFTCLLFHICVSVFNSICRHFVMYLYAEPEVARVDFYTVPVQVPQNVATGIARGEGKAQVPRCRL